MNWLPMHSWHPVMVHFPLVALLLAVASDLIARRSRSERWRHAAGAFWLVGLLGAAAAVGTGLLAYNRVDHSEDAPGLMIWHRNIVLAAVALLVFAALWRRRRPASRHPLIPGIIGVSILVIAGYIGGLLVYRHALGIPTATLEQVIQERSAEEHEHGEPMGGTKPESPDSSRHLHNEVKP